MRGGIDVAVVVDSLVLASLGGSLLLLLAHVVVRRGPQRSGDHRQKILAYSLAGYFAVLLGTVVVQPGPVGCISSDCGATAGGLATSRALFSFTGASNTKFPDLSSAASRATPKAGSASRPGMARAFAGPLLVIWLIGLLIGAIRLARTHWSARGLIRGSVPVRDPVLLAALERASERLGFTRKVRLLEGPGIDSPMVAGIRRPALLLPDGSHSQGLTTPQGMDAILLHEVAHLCRRDPLITLLEELAGVLFWFNPLVAFTARRSRELQEVAADSVVLRAGVRPSIYAQLLIDAFQELMNRRPVRQVATPHGIVGDCLMDTRLRTILDPNAKHGPASGFARGATALLVGAACATLVSLPEALQAHGLLPQETRPSQEVDGSVLNSAALDSIVRPIFINHMADRYIAGAAISVVHQGELVYREGFGRQEVFEEAPVDAERTIWRIGSITKFVTGVAVMQLVDRGLLSLDADVNDYLTGFQLPSPFSEPVRVRDLLTHTSGFDQVGLGRHVSSAEEVRPLGEFLEEYLVRIRPPGEYSTYDTYGITLAGYLVEQVTGLGYEEYLQRYIFGPLEMHRSGIAVPPALREDFAVGYGFAGTWEAQRWEFMNTDPASTVNASVGDMANLMTMILTDGEFRGRRVLDPTSARAMMTRQWTNHPDHHGYGLTLWEDQSWGVTSFSHGGSMSGYGSLLFMIPEHDIGIFIAYNQESGSLPHAVLTGLMDAIFPNRPTGPELRPRLASQGDVSRFTGTWANSMHHHTDPTRGWRVQPFQIDTDDTGHLVFQDSPAFRVGPLTFQREDGLLMTFRENERGEVTTLFVNQTVFEKQP